MSRFFDGVDDNIQTPLDGTALTEFTVTFNWYAFDFYTTQEGILSWGDSSGDVTPFFGVTQDNGVFKFYADGPTLRGNLSFASKIWYRIGITLGTDNVWKFSIAPTNVGRIVTTTYQDDATHTDQASALNIFSGAGNPGGGGNAFGLGKMANLQVFNRRLAEGELLQAMNAPGTIRSGLILFQPLWGDQNPEPDFSGFNRTCTITGTTKDTNPPVSRPSQFRRHRSEIRSAVASPNLLISLSQGVSVNDSLLEKDETKIISDSITVTESKVFDPFLKNLSDELIVNQTLIKEIIKILSDSVTVANNVDVFLTTTPIITISLSVAISVSNSESKHLKKLSTQAISVTVINESLSPAALNFLASATVTFLNLQSGNARPFYYIEGIISGVTSVFGLSYDSTANWLIDGGVIDRQKSVLPGDRVNIISADVTIKLDNSTRRFSPNATGSVFYNNEYLESPVNYWAGFQTLSGEALLLQRGSFLLDDLKIDTRKNIAFLRLRDKFKRVLDQSIGRDISGTAKPLVFTGSQNGKAIMESLLITGAGLTGGDLDIQTASTSFKNISFDEQSVSEALQCIAEASDGYIFSTREGKIKFVSYEPVWGTSTTAHYALQENHNYSNLFWEQNKKDRLSTVVIAYGSGASATVIFTSVSQSANSVTIDNDCIQSTADAVAIGGRILDRFSGQITKIEIPAVWIPTLEIGQTISVSNSNSELTGALFEIARIQEEPTEGKMKITCYTDRSANGLGRFNFFSDPSAVVCGTVFTGGILASGTATEQDGWQNSWCFVSRDLTTAINPGHDAMGNNNNVINTGYAASGVGATGIEMPCQIY